MSVTGTNEQHRRAAKWAERSTFTMAVVEHWPACVDCAQPIRRNVPGPPRPGDGEPARGLHRACGCKGRVWRSTMTGHGWEIVSPGAPSGAGDEVASGGGS